VPAPSEPPSAADQEHDTPMTGTYVAVVVVEAMILALLWLLGRVYS
jgi:hypothetical protein